MPSFGDSAFIFILALLLFGPKKLPELARQLGKLMAEFRRASNEFRMQMDEELRLADQAEQQKKIAAMEAAAPTPSIAEVIPEPEHPHIPLARLRVERNPSPLAIATEGELSIKPPSTGLPTPTPPTSPRKITPRWPPCSTRSLTTPTPQPTPSKQPTTSTTPASPTATPTTDPTPPKAPSEAPLHG